MVKMRRTCTIFALALADADPQNTKDKQLQVLTTYRRFGYISLATSGH